MHPTLWRAVRLGALLLFVTSLGFAANWDRFRGPNGTGDGGNAALPDTFTKDSIIWKVEVPGMGHSSPIVWGDRLFLQTASADGGARDLLCYNALTGEKLWSQGIKATRGHTHPLNTLASSTPTTDGARVYTVFWDGKSLLAVAYTFAGKEVWKKNLGAFASDHGFGASPVVSDGKVFLNDDQGVKEGDGSPSSTIALDAKTGAQVWKTPHKSFRSCSSAPLVNDRPDGKKELIISSTAGLAGYDPNTGKAIWHYTWSFSKNNLRTVGSPILSNGLVIANSGEGGGDRNVIAVKLGGTGDITKSGLAWKGGKTFPYVPTILAHGDHLFYTGDKSSAIICCAARTGKELWNVRNGSAGFTASPVLAGDRIYTVDNDGNVRVLKAATTYTPLGERFALDERVSATPAIANDRMYIRGSNHLFCLGKR